MLHFAKSVLALAAVLGCCASALADDATWTRFLVAPGNYVLFNCQQLDAQAKKHEKRRRDLEELMARSGSAIANAVAYRPEYLQITGELADIRREAAAKKCKTVPGGHAPRRVNSAIIR